MVKSDIVFMKKLILLILLLCCAQDILAQQSENTFVLIISNEKYEDEVQDVPFAINDGNEFKLCCEKTLGIPSEQIRFYKNATLNHMRSGLRWLGNAIKSREGDAYAIVFYSGHGMPSDDGKHACLLPVDGDGMDERSGIRTQDLYKELGSMPTKGTTVFLDACFSGATRNGQMLTASRGVALKVKDAPVSGKLVVFSAAQGNETAYPYKEKKHGLFTYYLLKNIRDNNGIISLGKLSESIKKQVEQKSILVNNKIQHPTVSASSYFADWKSFSLKSMPSQPEIKQNQDTEDSSVSDSVRIKELEKERNTAWFVLGTLDELEQQNIIKTQKKDSTHYSDYYLCLSDSTNFDYFTKIDIRVDKKIKLYSKYAMLISQHPKDSYTFFRDQINQYVIDIIDPKSFWYNNKYLVVRVK